MDKKFLTLFFASALLLSACSDTQGSDVVVEDNGDEETEIIEEVEAEEEVNESKPGSRSNPVELGQTATQDFIMHVSEDSYEANRSITITDLVRGEEVYNYLIDENEYNEEAPEGMEWAMVDVEYTLNESETEDESDYVFPDFKVIDSAGSEIPQDEVFPTLNSGEFGYVEIYSGGTASGKYVFYAPQDESVLLKYDDMLNKPLFFNLD